MIRRLPLIVACVAAIALAAAAAHAQQVADTTFRPVVGAPRFAPGEGPLVLIDEGHLNFHTMDGRYLPFARLLERDGWRVAPHRGKFTRESLAQARVLVIANALGDTGEWVLPTKPAFTSQEVSEVKKWVEGGGSLFLIADHMPFPGANENLAKAFGVEFLNGFAGDSLGRMGIAMYRRRDGSLADCVVTNGDERIDSIATFTGQGFRLKGKGTPVLTMDRRFAILMPKVAWEFGHDTKKLPGAGLFQGVLLERGDGRVAVFGEAAMFSAQLGGPNGAPMGMNIPLAGQNARLALNVMRWLAKASAAPPAIAPSGGR
jgi:hypothetical protein